MNIAILYLSMSFIYILLVCLDGEDVKPKWKQWLADQLGIKPIAKCYNGDWKPDWNSKEYKHNIMRTSEYGITSSSDYNEGAIYFKNKEDAQAVIDNPNFRSILDAIYKD